MSTSERPRKDATFLKLSNANSLPIVELINETNTKDFLVQRELTSDECRDYDNKKFEEENYDKNQKQDYHNKHQKRDDGKELLDRDNGKELLDRGNGKEFLDRDNGEKPQEHDAKKQDFDDKLLDKPQNQDDKSQFTEPKERRPPGTQKSKPSGNEQDTRGENVQDLSMNTTKQLKFRSKREEPLYSADLRTRHTASIANSNSDKQHTFKSANASNGFTQNSSKEIDEPPADDFEIYSSRQSEKSNLSETSFESQTLTEDDQSTLTPSRLSCISNQSNRDTPTSTSSRFYPEIGYPETCDILKPNYPPIGYPPVELPKMIYPQTKFPDTGEYPGVERSDSDMYLASESSLYYADDVSIRLESRSVSAYSDSSGQSQASVRFKDMSPYPQ